MTVKERDWEKSLLERRLDHSKQHLWIRNGEAAAMLACCVQLVATAAGGVPTTVALAW